MKAFAMFLATLACGIMFVALATPDYQAGTRDRVDSYEEYTPPTNRDVLDGYHRQGRFLGYDDPDELARDMKVLEAMGSEEARGVARELGY